MNTYRNTVGFVSNFLPTRFLLSVLIFVLAGVGLRGGMLALEKRYTKHPINVRRSLREFNISGLSSFQNDWNLSIEENLQDDAETDEFLYLALRSKDLSKRPDPMALFVTYYSDPNSKVPHTPDVCARQAGAVVKKMDTIVIDTPQLGPQYRRVKARLLILSKEELNYVKIYVFLVEGQFQCSREAVRWIIGKPGNRYSYFSKIEATTFYLNDDDDVTDYIEDCKTLFREALYILLKDHFPENEQIKRL